MRILTCFLFASLASACSGTTTGGGNDMAKPGDMAGGGNDMAVAAGDMAVLSQCGHPGDVGNSLGVGKYCTSIADCTGGGMMTNICSALGNGPNPSPDDTYFCTIYPCKLDGGTNCGENATCICAAQGCACTPDSCLGGPPPDGGATD